MNSVRVDDNSSSSAEAHHDLTEALLDASETEQVTETMYEIVPDPKAEKVDLSALRGVASSRDMKKKEDPPAPDNDLEGLAELVPDVKARRKDSADNMNSSSKLNEAMAIQEGDDAVEVVNKGEEKKHDKTEKRYSMFTAKSDNINRVDSMQVQGDSGELDQKTKAIAPAPPGRKQPPLDYRAVIGDDASSGDNVDGDSTSFNDVDSDQQALPDDEEGDHHDRHSDSKMPKEFMNLGSSAQSISTATQTHEVRMPMYLPTFKPATGCTNASDFIVRCFVARLRSGITVVKHGRSRWCKSRLRVLHIHPDGRSLSWKPAEGEPTSSKRPPKLDLSTCLEVRHAWSPDPQNPMYTGTPILRQKCEAANAHKSFALIFKQRTVDITAVTADQCKVLMEGFSALCFRLQVANLAKRGQHARPMPEEDGVSTTASATLTNSSTPRGR